MPRVQDLYVKELTALLNGVDCNLTKEKSIELGKRKSNGDREAWDALYKSALWLAMYCARKFSLFVKDDVCFQFYDLVQEANVYLDKAVELYDYRKKEKFASFAFHHIRQRLELLTGTRIGCVRFPDHIFRLSQKYKKISSLFYAQHGRKPSHNEIAEIMGDTEKNVAQTIKLYARKSISMEETSGGDTSGHTYMDITDKEMSTLDKKIAQTDLKEEIMYLFSRLSAFDQEVIRAAYFQDHLHKLQEFADKYDRSLTWADTKRKNAIKKLRIAYQESLKS